MYLTVFYQNQHINAAKESKDEEKKNKMYEEVGS